MPEVLDPLLSAEFILAFHRAYLLKAQSPATALADSGQVSQARVSNLSDPGEGVSSLTALKDSKVESASLATDILGPEEGELLLDPGVES